MSVDLESARGVVLDLMERAADLEEALTSRIMADTRYWRDGRNGATVPPQGHPYRSDFEAWAETAGCRSAGRIVPPRFHDRDGRYVGLWTVATDGQVVSFEDWVAQGLEATDRAATDIATLLELRRFAAHPPTDAELREGWQPPAMIALEHHEDAILAGEDPETGLPADVVDWLRKLVHPPKQAYAEAYCVHRMRGGQAPEDPGTPWAVKARKRADRIMEGTNQ